MSMCVVHQHSDTRLTRRLTDCDDLDLAFAILDEVDE